MAKSFTWPFYAAALAALLAAIPSLFVGRRLGEHEGHEEMNRSERAEAASRRGSSQGQVSGEGAGAMGKRTRAGGRVARATGRRPGESGTREAILAASARPPSPTVGYDRTTIRGIAAAAEVDPALVLHYFGSKEGALRRRPRAARPARARSSPAARPPAPTSSAPPSSAAFLEAWEPPETRVRLMAMLRSAMTNDTAMAMIRDLLVREVFGPITQALGVPDAQLRATLVGSQFVGLAIMRFIGRARAARLGLDRRARRRRRADRAAVPDGRDRARRIGEVRPPAAA